MNGNLKKLVTAAMLIALSFLGSNIKIFGTIAFDSMPAFLGAMLLGPWYGALIGFLGHIFTSLLSGFPYGIPVHAVIAMTMAITMAAVGFCNALLGGRPPLNLPACVIVGVICNGPLSLLAVSALLIPMVGQAGVMALLPVLTIASLANAALAMAVYVFVKKAWVVRQ